jgi:hypothetical protein
MATPRLAQCIPVVTETVYRAVRSDANALLGLCAPTLPMFRPFVDCAPGQGDTFCMTPMRQPDDWALAFFLPGQKAFFVLNSGRLVYNFNHKVKECETDACNARACRVWNGTILGVERTETDWFAADAYVIGGKILLEQPFERRRAELLRLKDCMPTMKFVDDLDQPTGHRLWDLTAKLR